MSEPKLLLLVHIRQLYHDWVRVCNIGKKHRKFLVNLFRRNYAIEFEIFEKSVFGDGDLSWLKIPANGVVWILADGQNWNASF